MLMAALSPKARAVIDDAHRELCPPVRERERLEALLDARLMAPMASQVQHGPGLPPSAGAWRLVTSLTVGAALVGGAAFWALSPKPESSAPPPPSASARAQSPAPAIAVTTPVVEA